MVVSDAPAAGALLKDLTASQCLRLSTLLDESVELADEERAAWLDALHLIDSGWAAYIRRMFAAQGEDSPNILETRGFLASCLPQAHDPSLVGKRYGPYRIVSLLGHGGMGSVWLAERVDGLFTRQVALKLVHPALVGRVLTERSAREREILAALNHPNIARLIDAGFADDGQPYLALEYVAGLPLTAFCDQRRLAVGERLLLFRQVLSAVQYAHAHLVIHRDLKPSNILVTEEGRVYLLDFGIAKLLTEGEAKESELTRLGGRALTPDYAAPEQIAGAPITTAADVYALGVMLYEVLTGGRPYRLKRDTRAALEEAVLQGDTLPPSRATISDSAAGARRTTGRLLAKMIEGDLDTIVMKALKKFSSERYATVNAFDEDVARYLRGDVVLAQRDSFSYRARKFIFRHRVAMGAAGMVMLSLLGGLAATSYEAKIAAEQRDAALAARTRALTQTAAARLKDSDVPGAMAILVALSQDRGAKLARDSVELNTFQEARAADAQVLAITGHTGSIHTAAYSADGERIVTASADSTARIWDAATGLELMVLRGHTQNVRSAAFSPDGREVLTVAYDGTARTWDPASGRQLALLKGRHNRMHFASYSPDGRRIVIALGDGTGQVWDAAFSRLISELKGHTELMARAVFSPDGKRVATASFDKSASIWDAESGREIVQLKGHDGQVWSVAYSPDGGRLVTGSFDDSARIWDAATGKQLVVLSGHGNVVTSAEFSADGARVLTSSEDKTARVWDSSTGREIVVLNGHGDMLEMASFSPDNRHIVTAGLDATVRVWDLQSGSQMLVLAQHSDLVASAEFSADGTRILTSSWDGTIAVWEASTGRQIIRLDPHRGHIEFAAFSPDAGQIAAACRVSGLCIWDSASQREISKTTGHAERVEMVGFSPDGKRIVSASWDKTARVWDVATGHQVLVLSGHTDKLDSAAFSPDGRRIVTASYDKTARVWDANTGAQALILTGHSGRVSTAFFSPDGRRIVTASSDRTARIWDAVSGEQILVLSGDEDAVEMAAYSSDGGRIVTGSYDRTARVWDAATGDQLQVLKGHSDLVETALFSPDGMRVVTASDDKTARVWRARAAALEVQFSWAEAAQFDPLLNTERFQLGLPSQSNQRRWPEHQTRCDASAAAPYDPDRRARGVMSRQIVADIAIGACAEVIERAENKGRPLYQRGRALAANGKFAYARRDFEAAMAAGYRAARVDMAMLLSDPAAGMPDARLAVSLYEQAWIEGVSIAAFQIGDLYEHGLTAPSGTGFPTDEAKAWLWYQKGAEAGEPNALARIARKYDERNSWLEAFKYFASAAQIARSEDWPDNAWRDWRYRRASLARLLDREGMMQAVANEYDKVQARFAPVLTVWQRINIED